MTSPFHVAGTATSPPAASADRRRGRDVRDRVGAADLPEGALVDDPVRRGLAGPVGDLPRDARRARAGDDRRSPSTLPERPWLDLAVGTIEDDAGDVPRQRRSDGETTPANWSSSARSRRRTAGSRAPSISRAWPGRRVTLRWRSRPPSRARSASGARRSSATARRRRPPRRSDSAPAAA